jgi:4-amino-4-deoxy-L-arabinose transferase-like glycosyltransferase
VKQGTPLGESLGPNRANNQWGWLWDATLLTGFALLVYFSRLTTLPLRGEESRRAQVAIEMVKSGDWVVPTQQGNPFFMSSRPPLQNWTIAMIGRLRGTIDLAAVRLPSVTALLLTLLLVYAYSRLFLSRIGAVAAALAYGSMGQVMELCRLGETDSMFALWVSGSLLVWHSGQVRGWPSWRVWTAAYLLVALGTLTKGIQAPVYFAAGVGSFLLVTGRWRQAFTKSHAAGIAIFLAVWGVWQVPFFARMGWPGLRHVYFGDVVRYVHDRDWLTIARHLTTYPLEILFACLMPWSILLLLYLRRDFRRALGGASEHVVFLTCCILATFPTVWFPPTAKTRFFLSMYPAFAILAGLVVDRCCEADYDGPWRRFWGFYLTAGAVVMAAAGGAIVVVSTLRPSLSIAQPIGFAVVLAVVAVGLAWMTYWSGNSRTPQRRAVGTLTLAAFLGLVNTGIVVDAVLKVSNPLTESAVAELRNKLPEATRLVSLGFADHLFAYYYRDSIPTVPWPEDAEDLPPDVEYFCFSYTADEPFWSTFAFEPVDEINCDRALSSKERVTIVGRRPPSAAAVAETTEPNRPSRR